MNKNTSKQNNVKIEEIDTLPSVTRKCKMTKPQFLSSLPALTKTLRKRGFAETRLLTHWSDIIGVKYARYSRPDRLTKNTTGQNLILKIHHSMSVEMQQIRSILIQKINQYFGYNLITSISFIQTSFKTTQNHIKTPDKELLPAQITTLDKLVKNIKNPDVKNAITLLATYLFGTVPTQEDKSQNALQSKATSWRDLTKDF